MLDTVETREALRDESSSDCQTYSTCGHVNRSFSLLTVQHGSSAAQSANCPLIDRFFPSVFPTRPLFPLIELALMNGKMTVLVRNCSNSNN